MPMSDITPLRPMRTPVPGILMGPDLERITTEAIAALAREADIYQRSGELVEVVVDNPQTRGLKREGPIARLHRCSADRILELLSRVQWISADSSGGQRLVRPPKVIAGTVMARGGWPGIRPISEVKTAPTMRLDGSILSAAGYDEATGIFMNPSVEVAVPEDPTIDDARAALALLLDVIADFPTSSAGRAAWVASVLSVAVRPAIDGPVPMFIFEAPVAGSGKGLIVDSGAVIATGREAPKMAHPENDAEMRKLITAIALIGGDQLVVFDNVVGDLGAPSLDRALTAGTIRDRILGASAMTGELPVRVVFFATGNGVSIRGDLRRRALMVHLDPQVERPEERKDWRHPRLLDYIRENRAALLGAALTIVRAYVVAGRPDLGLRPMGSFERWSDLVRSALVWVGQTDPCDTIADLQASDVRTDALRAVLEQWPARDKEAVTAGDLLDRATPGSPWRVALLDWCPPRGADMPSGRAIGNALARNRRRILGGRMIDAAGRGKYGAQWVRLPVGGASGATSASVLTPPCASGENVGVVPDGLTSNTRVTQQDGEA